LQDRKFIYYFEETYQKNRIKLIAKSVTKKKLTAELGIKAKPK
jgi:hypothetical protein